MKKRKVGPIITPWSSIIWRLFHRRKRRASGKQYRAILDAHLKMHEEMNRKEAGLIVDGKFYEAAVEKFTETMMERVKLGEAPLTEASFVPDIPVVRVSKIPELLLLLGVRIRG